MRKRVQRLALTIAVLAVTLSVSSMLVLTIVNLRASEFRQVQLQANWLAVAVSDRIEAGLPVTATTLGRSAGQANSITVTAPKLQVTWRSSTALDQIVASSTRDKVRVTVGSDGRRLNTAIAEALATTGILVVILSAIAWLLVGRWSQRLQKTFDAFVDAARQLGSGDSRARGRRYGMDEFDEVAEVLDQSAERIEQLLRMERRLVSEASHQLRTPMTALGLQLELISAVADQPEEVQRAAQVAEQQVRRMSSAIDELIATRRGEIPTLVTPVLFAPLIEAVLANEATALRALKRELRVEIAEGVRTSAAAGAVRNIVAILLENARVHGNGQVTLVARDASGWLQVAVRDEGPGLPSAIGEQLQNSDRGQEQSVSKSIGLGLAMALAHGQFGRLEWRATEPATVRVYLPI